MGAVLGFDSDGSLTRRHGSHKASGPHGSNSGVITAPRHSLIGSVVGCHGGGQGLAAVHHQGHSVFVQSHAGDSYGVRHGDGAGGALAACGGRDGGDARRHGSHNAVLHGGNIGVITAPRHSFVRGVAGCHGGSQSFGAAHGQGGFVLVQAHTGDRHNRRPAHFGTVIRSRGGNIGEVRRLIHRLFRGSVCGSRLCRATAAGNGDCAGVDVDAVAPGSRLAASGRHGAAADAR